tara:strand:+ start:63 stop:392 length:330 start_codon:yes stop_codon:yes gene_type:complete
VELNAKFRLNQQKASQLDVKIALGRTGPREVLAVIVDSVAIVDLAMTDQEKCTKQLALIVELNAKFRLSQHKVSQLDAKIVLRKVKVLINFYFSFSFFIFLFFVLRNVY